MPPLMVYEQEPENTFSDGSITVADASPPPVNPISVIGEANAASPSETDGLVQAVYSVTYDFDEAAFYQDIAAAREAFEHDNEGLSWEEFAAEYLDDLRAVRESRAEGAPTRPLEDVCAELGL